MATEDPAVVGAVQAAAGEVAVSSMSLSGAVMAVMNRHIFNLIISYWGACLINQRTVSSSVLSLIILLFITEAVLMSDTRPTHG